MTEKSVFFSRCRPQGCDPIDIVIRERRIFIGYPAWRNDAVPQRGHLRDAVVDLWCSDAEWNAFYETSDRNQRKQYQQNRNFVRRVTPGSIALVPRPDRGVIYAGRIVKHFELIDDPLWSDEYLRLREEQQCDEGGGEFSHLADVAQCCEVDIFRPLPFPLIPAWIRSSLFGRSTYGHIKPLSELELDPFTIMDRLLDHPERIEQSWTLDVRETERRLVDGVGPNTFEHLCVSLLQLECPSEIWAHVGGSGDGGVDGLGTAADGKVVGLLQCKWRFGGEDLAVAAKSLHGEVRQLLAILLHRPNIQSSEGLELWPRNHIASLVVKHAAGLPLAKSLRIGVTPR